MNVLSLFDGMSCGRIALERAGIPVTSYFASEIDKYAIAVSQNNWVDITHIGDVTKVDSTLVPDIDLLIGGSPCQGFSFAGKQLNFNDPRSALFFEYVRILKDCKPKYFFLENVKMNKEYENIISDYLGVSPFYINSGLLSAQNRSRLYWTNIPFLGYPKDKNLIIKHIIQREVDSKYFLSAEQIAKLIPGGNQKKDIKILFHRKNFRRNLQCYDVNGKTECLDTGGGGGRFPSVALKLGNTQPSGRGIKISIDDYMFRRLTPIECERLQTVSDNYTSCVSNSQRYKMLGNGWTVDIIAHLFKGLNCDETLL